MQCAEGGTGRKVSGSNWADGHLPLWQVHKGRHPSPPSLGGVHNSPCCSRETELSGKSTGMVSLLASVQATRGEDTSCAFEASRFPFRTFFSQMSAPCLSSKLWST